MFRFIKDKYKEIKSWKNIVWDKKPDSKVPFTAKLVYALRGFSAQEYVNYDFAHNDYRKYISELERLNSRDIINRQYKFILDDKLVFEEVYGQYTNVPTNYAWVKDGIVYGLHGNGMNNDNLIDYLKQYRDTVLKWNGKGGGAGTKVIFYHDDKFYVNESECDEETVKNMFNRKGEAILCQYIKQSAFEAGLYPHTTNTIRIVCAKKRGEKSAEFITAVQRVGCKDSIPVDNASSGGLVLPIDPESGELGCGIAIHGSPDRVRIPFDKHPDTGEAFVGKKIPDWKELVNQMVDLTNKIPYLYFVAWDILLTDDGYYIIEGNASSGVGIFQTSGGIRDSKFGDIFRDYGIIK